MKPQNELEMELNELDKKILIYLEKMLQQAIREKLSPAETRIRYSTLFRKDMEDLIDPVGIHPTGGFDENAADPRFVLLMHAYFKTYFDSLTSETKYKQHPHHELRQMLENATKLSKQLLESLNKEIKQEYK